MAKEMKDPMAPIREVWEKWKDSPMVTSRDAWRYTVLEYAFMRAIKESIQIDAENRENVVNLWPNK